MLTSTKKENRMDMTDIIRPKHYNTGVIDVFINALRKKLKLGKDENYIQTVRGVGYIAKEI